MMTSSTDQRVRDSRKYKYNLKLLPKLLFLDMDVIRKGRNPTAIVNFN